MTGKSAQSPLAYRSYYGFRLVPPAIAVATPSGIYAAADHAKPDSVFLVARYDGRELVQIAPDKALRALGKNKRGPLMLAVLKKVKGWLGTPADPRFNAEMAPLTPQPHWPWAPVAPRTRIAFADGIIPHAHWLGKPDDETFTACLRADARRFSQSGATTEAPTAWELEAVMTHHELEIELPDAELDAGVFAQALQRTLNAGMATEKNWCMANHEDGTVRVGFMLAGGEDAARAAVQAAVPNALPVYQRLAAARARMEMIEDDQ